MGVETMVGEEEHSGADQPLWIHQTRVLVARQSQQKAVMFHGTEAVPRLAVEEEDDLLTQNPSYEN